MPGTPAKIQVTASVAGLPERLDRLERQRRSWADVASEIIATRPGGDGGRQRSRPSPLCRPRPGVVYSRFRFTQTCGQGGDSADRAGVQRRGGGLCAGRAGRLPSGTTRTATACRTSGEPGHSSVTVNLLDGSGNPVLDADNNPITTTTDASGKYEFPGLPAGSYSVAFVAPAGYSFTTPDQGGDDTTDSDADATTGRTPPVTLTPGENNPTVDAGLVLTYDFGDLPDTTARGRRLPDAAGQQRPAARASSAACAWARRSTPRVTASRMPPATGDDTAGAPDDEDGVVFLTPLMPGTPAKIQVTASVAGCLNAWIDWNGNGAVGRRGQRVIADRPGGDGGRQRLTISPCAGHAQASCTAASASRRRAARAAAAPTGPASSGEVEDYALAVPGRLRLGRHERQRRAGQRRAGHSGVTVNCWTAAATRCWTATATRSRRTTRRQRQRYRVPRPAGRQLQRGVRPAGRLQLHHAGPGRRRHDRQRRRPGHGPQPAGDPDAGREQPDGGRRPDPAGLRLPATCRIRPYPTLLANNGARHLIVSGVQLGAASTPKQRPAECDGDGRRHGRARPTTRTAWSS